MEHLKAKYVCTRKNLSHCGGDLRFVKCYRPISPEALASYSYIEILQMGWCEDLLRMNKMEETAWHDTTELIFPINLSGQLWLSSS